MSKDIKDTLYDMYDEFMAQGAWMGHAYGFENMREYYDDLEEYMDQNALDGQSAKDAYKKVVDEFDRVSDDDSLSFLNDEDTKKLEELDQDFMDKLAQAAQVTADHLHVNDIRFHESSDPDKNRSLYLKSGESSGFVVDKVKSVRIGDIDAMYDVSEIEGAGGQTVEDVISDDISDEFKVFLATASHETATANTDVYQGEHGDTLTVKWAEGRKSAVCRYEAEDPDGIRSVTEISYNGMQYEHEFVKAHLEPEEEKPKRPPQNLPLRRRIPLEWERRFMPGDQKEDDGPEIEM